MFAASKTDSVSAAGPEDKFNYVTMLLHGDGTNGAQNNTFLDSSTNNFTITRNGNTTQGSFSPYGSNWSNAFTASSGSYLSVPYSSAFNLTGDFTVECWINPSQLPTANQTGSPLYPRIFSFGTYDAANSIGLEINSNDGGIVNALVVWYNGSNYYSSNNIVAVGNWYHCAMVRSGTTIKIYLNGTSVITITGASAAVNTSQALFIGSLHSFTTDANACFKGSISNFRVVKGTAVYTSTFTPPTTPLTAITNTVLLTCQSNRFVDNSTTAATITSFGTTSVQRFNPFGTSTAYSTSVIGGSGYFDGTGDNLIAVSANTANAMGTGDWTAEAWIYLTTGGGTPFVFDTLPSGSGSATGLRMRLNASNQLQLWQYGSAVLTSSASVTVNAWTHVALVKNSGTTTAYVNGTASNTYSDSGNYICGTNRPMIGSDGFNNGSENSFPGYISNLRLVKGTAVYTASFTPNTAPLSAITNTSLLTNFTNGAIIDNAMMNDLETVGNAQISTSVKKYGTGSLAFDGSGDWLLCPDNPSFEFGSGDFTLECWINTTISNSGYVSAVSKWGTSNQSWMIRAASIDIGSGWSFFYSTDGSGYSTVFGSSINDGNWHHLAVTRSGNVFRTFTDGTLNNSATAAVTLFDGTASVFVGAQSAGGNPFTGYIDDVRITKGYARYTATFTAPTAAFSDTGPY
jgi:hypothetical protein